MAHPRTVSSLIPSGIRPAFLATLIAVAGCAGGGGLFIGCGGGAPQAGPAAAPAITQADVPLIPRRLLFGNPEKAGPTLSDDGKQLAFRAAVDGVMNVWVGPSTSRTPRGRSRKTPRAASASTSGPTPTPTSSTCRTRAATRTGASTPWMSRLGETKDLTPFDKVAAQIQGVSDRFPDEILVALNNRNPELHDLYRINIRTGAAHARPAKRQVRRLRDR